MNSPKFSIYFSWKAFKVHLPDFEAWIKSVSGEIYLGNYADERALTLLFSEEPTPQLRDSIMAHWDSLTEAIEQTRISNWQRKNKAEAAAMVSLPYQSWDQMIPAERKLAMGQALTESERDSLLSKYPHV